MPLPFNPARMAGAARGLTVVEGGGAAARMRALVRRARATGAADTAQVAEAASRAAPRATELDVLGPEGYERTVRRQPAVRFSPEATAAQQAQALRAHGRPRPGPFESPESPGGTTPLDELAALRREAGLPTEPTASPALRKAFKDRFGWDPAFKADAWIQDMLDTYQE